MNKGAWQATVHGIKQSWTRLSDFQFVTNIINTAEATGHPSEKKKYNSYFITYTKNKFQMNCRFKQEVVIVQLLSRVLLFATP